MKQPTDHNATNTAHTDEVPITRKQRFMLLILPVMGLGFSYLLAHWITDTVTAHQMAAAAAASVMGLGTTVIVGGAVLGESGFDQLSAWDLALVVSVLGALLTIMYIGGADLMDRLPWLGPKLAHARKNARLQARDHPWIRRWASLGVGFFVVTPLPGSGVLGGCIIGRVVGLTRWQTFLTVTAANIVVSVLYAWGAQALGAWMAANEMTLMQRLALFAGGILLFFVLVKFSTGGFSHDNAPKS